MSVIAAVAVVSIVAVLIWLRSRSGKPPAESALLEEAWRQLAGAGREADSYPAEG